jgi:hypothetical protein
MPTKYYYDNYLMTLCDIPDSLLRRNIGSKHEQSAAIQKKLETGAVHGTGGIFTGRGVMH